MATISKVSLIGGSGHLGTHVLEKLVASNKFSVQVVKRAGSASTFPGGVKVVEADYSNVESLKTAFTGQDAVVSIVGDPGVASQKTMIDAAAAAGVKRFLPSNFGSNMANPHCRKVPVFGQKVQVEDYLMEKCKTTPLTYSLVYTGALIDFTIKNKVTINCTEYAPTVYDGGDATFSGTSMATVGEAVVGVLSHPEETKNRNVYVSEIFTTQNKMIELAKEIAPNKPWQPTKSISMDETYDAAVERLSRGIHDLPTIIPILLKTIFTPSYGVNFTVNDNELLGIKVQGDDFLKKFLAGQVN